MDTLTRFLCVLHALADCPTGATAGMVAKRVGGYGCDLSRAQCELTLKQMTFAGYARKEIRPYRSNMNSTYYHMTDYSAMALAEVLSTYNDREKQRALAI